MAGPGRPPAAACVAIWSWSRTAVVQPTLDEESTGHGRPGSSRPRSLECRSRAPPGRTMGNQPSAIRPIRRKAAGARPPIQIGIGRGAAGSEPDAVMWWNFLSKVTLSWVQSGATRQPVLPGVRALRMVAQGLVLEAVPADAQPQPEAPVAEEVELGHLLGQQRGLALGSDEDGGGESEPGDSRPGRRRGPAAHGTWCGWRRGHRCRRAPLCRPPGRGRTPPGGGSRGPRRPARWRATAPRSPPISVCGKMTPISIGPVCLLRCGRVAAERWSPGAPAAGPVNLSR